MTIKQKIEESSREAPIKSPSHARSISASWSSLRRSPSRLVHLRPSYPRSSSSSEDSSRDTSRDSFSDDAAPHIDQPFKDGRRRKICHACNHLFGEHEHVEICNSCCFERPAGCRDCNWTGWGTCTACAGQHCTIESRPFAAGYRRVPVTGEGQQTPRQAYFGLK